jgi:stress response protein YsnF
MKYEDGLLQCSRLCLKHKMNCHDTGCKFWIDFKKEQNCTLISIYENGRMTLREVAERLGISFARVKQIETQAMNKIKKRCLNKGLTF